MRIDAVASPTRYTVFFAVESYESAVEELRPLTERHWQEVALNQDKVKLSPVWERYEELARQGILRVIVARNSSKQPVGYIVALVMPHLHYRELLTAYVDIFFLLPEARNGMTGAMMFAFFESEMRRAGVRLMLSGTKLKLDLGKLFEWLDWTESDHLYQKLLD